MDLKSGTLWQLCRAPGSRGAVGDCGARVTQCSELPCPDRKAELTPQLTRQGAKAAHKPRRTEAVGEPGR